MKTFEYCVRVPDGLKNPADEIKKRTAGTDMIWEHDFSNYYRITVSVDSDDEGVVLEESARKVYAAFKDICNPEVDELPNPRTAHEIIKYYDKERRRTEKMVSGYLQDLGDGWANVSFTLITHSELADPDEAAADCERQVAEIIDGQDMEAALDIPVRLQQLKKSGTPAFFANYRIAVRVPQQGDYFKTTSVAAGKMWERVKERRVYTELDDMNGTLLEAIIKYYIPKSRRSESGETGGIDA